MTSRHLPDPAAKALLAALSFAISLAFAEAAARLFWARRVGGLPAGTSDFYYAYDHEGIRRHIPGKTGRQRSWDGRGAVPIRINRLGFRGDDPPPGPVAGTLAVIGDSVVFGTGMREEDTFCGLLAGRISAAGGRWNVINAGLEDAGLVEEDRVLRDVLRAAPDAVLWVWYLNDRRPPLGFQEEVVYANPFVQAFDRAARWTGSRLALWIEDRVRSAVQSRRIRLMEGSTRRFEWTDEYLTLRWRDDPNAFRSVVRKARFDWGDAWDPDGWVETGRRIRAVRDAARRAGARFALIATPVYPQIYARYRDPFLDDPQRRMSEFCRREGIPFLDLLPALRTESSRRLMFDQCHYTPEGHRVVADALADFLRRLGWTDARKT